MKKKIDKYAYIKINFLVLNTHRKSGKTGKYYTGATLRAALWNRAELIPVRGGDSQSFSQPVTGLSLNQVPNLC